MEQVLIILKAYVLLDFPTRANRRIQRFTLDGKRIDFVEGTRLPCHFHAQKGAVVVPDLMARVTLMDKDNKGIAHLR